MNSLVDQGAMRRALALAARALGTTWPNPGVGCILVRDGRVIGAGATAPWSSINPQEHAEAGALRHARALGHDPVGATAYVTLAPCTRRSRPDLTACADHLIAARIARVVVAVADPHQLDSPERFAQAGIPWESGVGEAEARQIHGGFLTRMTLGRPRFTGKWAATLDGFLATVTGHSGWISSPEALALSRRRRRAFDAILVGSGTATQDDPQLLASRRRPGERPGPLRIVVSAGGRLPLESRLLATLASAPLLLMHGPGMDPIHRRELAARGVDLREVANPHDPRQIAAALGEMGLNEILVEGGSRVHAAFLAAGLYDRLEIYHGARTLGGGLAIAAGPGAPRIPDGQGWRVEVPPRLLGDTVLLRYCR